MALFVGATLSAGGVARGGGSRRIGGRRRHGRRQPHLGAVAQAVRAINDNLLARSEARADDCARRVRRPGCHFADRDGVVVLQDIDEGALSPQLHAGVGRYDNALQRVDQQPDIDELVRKQRRIRIREGRAQLERAGRQVDLIVERGEFAHGELAHIGAIEGRHAHRRARVQPARDSGEIVLGGREYDADRVYLRDDHDAGGVAGGHVISGIDLPQADAPRNGRNYARVAYVHPGRIDLRLIAGHGALVLGHHEDLIIDLLAGDRILLLEGLVAGEIRLRLLIIGGVLVERALRLRQGGFIGRRIDLGEEIPGLDQLAFREADPQKLAGDLGFYRDGRERRNRAESVERDGHVAGGRLDGAHGLRRRSRGRRGLGRIQRRGADILDIEAQGDDRGRQRQNQQKPPKPVASWRGRRTCWRRGRLGIRHSARGDRFVHSDGSR